VLRANAFGLEQGFGNQFRAGCCCAVMCDLLVVAQRLFDGSRIKDGDRCPAMGASTVVPDIDRSAAAGTAYGADLDTELLDFGAIQLTDKALLDHELGEGDETAVLLDAAQVIEEAAFHPVLGGNQAFFTARAMQDIGQGMEGRITLGVQQFEQSDDAVGCELQAFVFVKPDAAAGKAQVQIDGAMHFARKSMM